MWGHRGRMFRGLDDELRQRVLVQVRNHYHVMLTLHPFFLACVLSNRACTCR